jgi:phage shock protein A
MDKGRAKFQQKLARQKVALPGTIRTAAPKVEAVLQEKVSALNTQIAEATTKRDTLKAQLGAV